MTAITSHPTALLEAGTTPREIVAQLYLHCRSRRPPDDEAKAINEQLAPAADPRTALEDVF